ncbi:DUF4352 domain-containing protein [Streptomyces sp. NPDC058257]|uniref:DUF4352 domain-containing protein n=1 Tax=Streptomyces sp. NPDC058257 TaxID=3346409 RepID=UPI0036E4B3C9
MRTYIRRAVLLTAPLALASTLVTGCSASRDSSDKAEPKELATASTDFEKVEVGEAKEASEPPSTAPEAPALAVGETGTYETGKTDEYGENYKVTTKMQVKVVSAKYVTPAEIDTTNEPEQGQFVKLTLSLKNVGKGPAEFSAYGLLQWEDEETAAQDATTLEGVGDGPDLDAKYKPGQSVTGSVVLDVARKGGTVSYVGNEDPEAEGPVFTVELPK